MIYEIAPGERVHQLPTSGRTDGHDGGVQRGEARCFHRRAWRLWPTVALSAPTTGP